jgi:hypothetical protein
MIKSYKFEVPEMPKVIEFYQSYKKITERSGALTLGTFPVYPDYALTTRRRNEK